MVIEYTAVEVQTVAADDNVIFNRTTIGHCETIMHSDGSGLITLKGCQCKSAYRVSFGANIAVAEGGTVGPVALAVAINGEARQQAVMIVTPAAVGDFFNVSTDIIICVDKCCCVTLSVKNVSDPEVDVDVQNANIIVNRIA